MTNISRASVADANALYKAANYSGRAGPNDILLGIRQDQLICVARMMDYDDCYLVRHICTLPEYRRQGHASELCKALRSISNKPTYLFPLPELMTLYQAAGFFICNAHELPKSLTTVWIQSQKKYPTACPMQAKKTDFTAHIGVNIESSK